MLKPDCKNEKGKIECKDCVNKKLIAATEALPIIVKDVQPKRKAVKFPKIILRYSYSPPDSTVSVASPETDNAPITVTMPATTQAAMIKFSLRPEAAMGAIFLKMPVPIIMPITRNILPDKDNTLFKRTGVFFFIKSAIQLKCNRLENMEDS